MLLREQVVVQIVQLVNIVPLELEVVQHVQQDTDVQEDRIEFNVLLEHMLQQVQVHVQTVQLENIVMQEQVLVQIVQPEHIVPEEQVVVLHVQQGTTVQEDQIE